MLVLQAAPIGHATPKCACTASSYLPISFALGSEVPEAVLDEVVSHRAEVVAAVEAAGYRWVTLDLAGLRSGGFNQLLPPTSEVG